MTTAATTVPSRRSAWGVRWDRTPPRSVVDAVASFAPINDVTTGLLPSWEAGDPWQPIERWGIWQVFPARTLPLDAGTMAWDIWKELRGPHPRSAGHWCADGWCACRTKLDGWRGSKVKCINRRQWELYRETGRYCRLWWIVQGEHGGHRYRLDQTEQRILQIHTGRSDVPAPGDLPYAPIDARVFDAIRHYDRVEALKSLSRFGLAHQGHLEPEESALIEQANAALWSYMGDRMRNVW